MQVVGTGLVAAGKRTDADTSDRTIAPTKAFNHISVKNDGGEELRLAVDTSSRIGASILFIGAGEAFEDDVTGSVLHYSVAGGTTVFRYALR